VALSSDKPGPPAWSDLFEYARLIPRVCHNVNRVCFAFGPAIREPVTDVTPTYLTMNVVATLREADHVTSKVLRDSGCYRSLAQMPVVLIPIHFDRDSTQRIPSCQRSIVLRPFVSSDFMTGVPGVPDVHIPHQVNCNTFVDLYMICVFNIFFYVYVYLYNDSLVFLMNLTSN
jgi:GMP synthase (glutamine-hydrolysing)